MKRKIPWSWITPAAVFLLMFILLKQVFLIGYVPTESMEPTVKKGSYIAGSRIFFGLETGDVVVFQREGKLLVKRIAAVSGETVRRNGYSIVVPEDCYYMLGDNQDCSYDSRYWEDPFIEEKDVMAKVILIQ